MVDFPTSDRLPKSELRRQGCLVSYTFLLASR